MQPTTVLAEHHPGLVEDPRLGRNTEFLRSNCYEAAGSRYFFKAPGIADGAGASPALPANEDARGPGQAGAFLGSDWRGEHHIFEAQPRHSINWPAYSEPDFSGRRLTG